MRVVFTGQASDIIRKKRTDIGGSIVEAFNNIFFCIVFEKKMDDKPPSPPPPFAEYQIPRTWEEVDEILFDELKAQKLSLQLKTTERRMFALIAINNYLIDTLTNHMQWCISSALAFTAGFAPKIEELKERARHMKRELDEYQHRIVSSPYDHEKINELILERHLELTDPDKKIWSRLRRGGLVQRYVDAEYNKARRQQRLPPNEAAFNYNARRGETVLETSTALAQAAASSRAVEQDLSNFEFFEKYMRSDESLAPSNKLSEAYNVPYEVLPNNIIKVPRRIERYINGEIEFMTKVCAPTISNYTRGIVLSYMVGRMFGCAYLTSQAYMKAFADAVVERSPFFINKVTARENVTLSYSEIKLVLKSAKKRAAAAAAAAASTNDSIMTFPASHLSPVDRIPSGTRETRESIVKASEYSPSRMDKLAVILMRSPVAEQAINGPIAEWFAINMSLLVGRKLDPQYALLLLVNWALTNTEQELLKRVTNTFNIFFHHATGLAVPNIGFGVGMTRHRLKAFAKRLITQFVAPLVVKGSRNIVKPEPKTHTEVKDYGELVRMVRGNPECKTASENSDLIVMSSGLFTNNDVYKKLSSSTSYNEKKEEDRDKANSSSSSSRCCNCDCGCHGIDGNLVGLTFEPSEARRKIYEEEYNKMLMSQPHLLAEFGVCGYRYSLTASSDKKILVMLQLLKERLIYTQREVAAAIGWSRLLQFFLTNDKNNNKKSKYDIHNVKNKLFSLNRRYIEHFSTTVRNSVACARLTEDLNAKFNSDMFPLGRKPDSFIRTKAGLVVMEHAKKVLADLYLREDSYPDYKRLVGGGVIPQYMIDAAARCVTGADYAQEYHIDEPFCKRDEEHFEPIPMFGVKDLLFVDPADAKYVFDNTAIKSCQPESVFRIKRDDVNFTEANVARGVISNAQLTNNVDAAKVLFSGNNSCKPVFKGMGDIFRKNILSEEPRKMDDHTPWSSKNTGQSGRNTTEFNVNSVMLVVQYDLDENGESRGLGDYENDVFLSLVDNQRTVAQNDIMYPKIAKFSESDPTETIEAPDYSPVYRHGSKTVAISLK
uniref:Wsv192-like protein n=1 Tax=Hemigrapsus takanoi nimavirus TaxID=2133792 RepID=A0A401INZ2_9VIRU|nr:MAG: wsv192-like protein [Hemigrapsus takanoi nimavirus]GBG35337.1 wsv192-like protein [Hemigrapsus takanoi nimavirus]